MIQNCVLIQHLLPFRPENAAAARLSSAACNRRCSRRSRCSMACNGGTSRQRRGVAGCFQGAAYAYKCVSSILLLTY